MHRTITVGLLSVCLAVFLCPSVGKPDVMFWAVDKPVIGVAPQHQSGGVETKGCTNLSQRHGKCCRQQQQSQHSPPSRCCPAPCSALVLMCTVGDKTRIPDFHADTIFATHLYGVFRTDRPPIPPPRS